MLNLFEVDEVWKQVAPNDGWMGQKVTFIVGQIQQGNGKQAGEFAAIKQLLVLPKLGFDRSDSHTQSRF